MNANAQLNTLDPRSLGDIQRLARERGGQSDEALRAAAKQFEGLLLQMMLKSMRAATPANDLMDSDQTRLYQELLDQQMASNLAQSGGTGLSEALFRQLGGGKEAAFSAQDGAFPLSKASRYHGNAAALEAVNRANQQTAALTASKPEDKSAAVTLTAMIDAVRTAGSEIATRAREFVAAVWPHALDASKSTGIPPQFMVAQAALETGWGEKQLRNKDGSPTYNLFNIKAGNTWTGQSTVKRVNEYENGQWTAEDAKFRAYSSYGEAFADYAGLLNANPRYAKVLGSRDATSFARALQEA
ncbi:MAG: flagellar assembly peptidoglycan hydrolase FlgJ, partial [Azoarcus sp.]|nr:flagellar assembly peptidoglycan hydrolase FlgJ [Azoarcus sp.]